jgi:nucleoside-diphosphate-sugar epimerase
MQASAIVECPVTAETEAIDTIFRSLAMNPSTVLVLGANGRFGAAAVQAFAAAGWRVLAQARRGPAQPLPRGAVALATPLADTAALAAQAAGASVVVYAVNPVYTRWDDELMPLFRQGVAVAQRLGARFMLPGNVYNFGEALPALLREDTPQRPSTEKGRQRVAMEAELRDLSAQGLDSTVIRAGDFFGAGSGSWLDLVIAKNIARGRLVYPGPLDRPHAWAYLPDLAQAFVAVAGAPGLRDVRGVQRLHFAGHTLTGREMLAALAEAAAPLGLRPAGGFRHGSLPWGLIRAAGWVHPMSREIARMSYLWRVPHALDGSALQRAVGPLPSTPIVAALQAALVELGHGPRARATVAAA